MVVVDFWQERDRASVVVYTNEDRDVTIAEWWDGQVHEMIEDGFFKFDDTDSVIAYCREVGLLPVDDNNIAKRWKTVCPCCNAELGQTNRDDLSRQDLIGNGVQIDDEGRVQILCGDCILLYTPWAKDL